jgi:hypothetical protein
MWTRRLLLATMVAAAAMSLPRHGSAPGNAFAAQAQTVSLGSLR